MGDSGDSQLSEEGRTLRIKLDRDPLAPSLARAAVAGFSKERQVSPSSLATCSICARVAFLPAIRWAGDAPVNRAIT